MKKRRGLSTKIYTGLVFLFLYAPIFVLIFFSFNQSKSRSNWTGFSLQWYAKLFDNTYLLRALLNTLIIAVIASVIATILGTMAAIGINAMKKLPRSAVINITYLPIVNPEIITGVSLMLLFVFMKIDLGMVTLIIAHITFSVPYVILNLMPKLRQMDKHLYEAALDLGCNPFQAFIKIVIPEILPGIISGFLMAFTYSIDDFVISHFTSGTTQTLPIAIFSMLKKPMTPEINALSTLIFIIVLSTLLIMNIRDIRNEKAAQKEKFL